MISIIIPTLNEEKYLPRLLNSIKKQKFQDYELIIADNNSKDRTREIAKKFGIKAIKGGLPGRARNNGAKIAKRNILLFLDSDVIMPSGFLNNSLKDFEKRKLNIALGGLRADSSKIIDKFFFLVADLFIKSIQYYTPIGGGYGIMIERRLHNKIGGFNESLNQGEDYDYINRAAKHGKFRVLKTKLYVSPRRFEAEGYSNLVSKTLKSTYYFIIGKKKKIQYSFDIYKSK